MKKIGSLLKKIVIVYLVFFILLANMSQCLGRAYDDSCGEYVADYAEKFVKQYGGNSTYLAAQEIVWTGGSFGNGTFKSCCTSGVKYMYEMALGINLYNYGYSALASNNLNITSQYWDKISTSEAKPGDILVRSGHVEMATSSGARDHADFGSTGSSSAVMHYNAHDTFTTAIRLKSDVDVNPNGKIAGAKSDYDEERDSIYGSNGFIYQGVATLSGYESGGTLGKWLFDTLLKILDWVIGILTYLVRIVIVGWTVIVERVFIDGIVNSVTGINNTSEPEEDEEEQLEDIGDEENPDEYVGTGVQKVANVGGSTKLTTSSKANVTIENIVFNRVPILDINFFNFETALTTKRNEGNVFKPGTLIGNSGEGIEVVEAQIDKNGIIYILKTSIATWYYTFRVMAVGVMLVILIYLGIRMAFSTVAEGKAVYKEMLIGWITGFILLFVMHYIMYVTIMINEAMVNFIVSTQVKLGGDEISLYETVRSKAYEIKASTGWAGTIMYMVLVYYSVRFLFIYLKRYFTVAILAVLSSLVALLFALEKINKKGKKAAVYGMWLKDFIYTVVLQSGHALIYVVFVGTALKLTEASLAGIMLSMIFLHFMMKNAEAILRKIMAFTAGPGDLMKDDLSNIANATVAGMSMKNIGTSYAKGVNKVVIRPVTNLVGSGLSSVSNRVRDLINHHSGERQLTDAERQNLANLTEIERREAEKKQEIKARNKEEVKRALGVAGSAVSGTLQTIGGLVGTIIEPAVGITLLGRGAGSFIDASDKLRDIKGPKPIKIKDKKKYTFNGVRLADRRAADQLILNLRRDNIEFTVDPSGRIKAGNNLREHRMYINRYVRKENLGANNGALRSGLRFATGKALADRISINESEADIKDRALLDLYGKAIDREKELVREYKLARAKQDKLIASIAQKDEKLAAKLQAKQDIEMESAMIALMDPIPMEDIEAAIESYKSKGGSSNIGFGENKEGLLEGESIDLEQKVQGISQELNRILEDKKSKVRVGDNFTNILKTRLMTVEELKAEKEEEENTHDRISGRTKGRRTQGTIDRNDPHSSQYAPQPVGTKSVEEIESELRGKKNDILNEQTKSTPRTPIRMKLDANSDEIKELMNNPNSSEYEPHEVGTKSTKDSGITKVNSNRDKTRELMNDPNSSRNAPKQGITSEESLSESIYKSARTSGAVEIDSDIRVETLQPIMLKLIELQQLNKEAELLGQEPLYDIEEIIKMLKET